MRFSWLICLCLFCPIFAWAQYGSISGKITRVDSKSPVARASAFLSNSSFGTVSADNGSFALNNLRPGQYTLVVTGIGYEDYTKTVLVSNEPMHMDIELVAKSIQLREVTITTSTRADWRRNYEQFKTEFIGSDKNAKDCEVINPDVLHFTYRKSKKLLEADADEFLIVENRALGYRVKYLVRNFRSDHISGIISYSGQQLFEELPAKESQKKKWRIKRDEAYYGSSMHFYRSLYKDRLEEEGFEMYRLSRMLNPNRAPEDVILRNIDKFKVASNSKSYNAAMDSLRYWTDMEKMSRYYMEDLSTTKYSSIEIVRTTDKPGIYAITFSANLYVIYNKKREETYFRDLYRPLMMPNYEATVLSFLGKTPVAFFDMNGVIMSDGPLYEGTWSKSRLSNLLPVDYVPTAEQASNKQAAIPAEK